MILRNEKFSEKILRKIFRTGKFSMENCPPHITNSNTAAQFSLHIYQSMFERNAALE
jgi:hypothetical protein